ncbi:MAG: glycosyltransferase family 2 protein [Planctomycetota bacterium]
MLSLFAMCAACIPVVMLLMNMGVFRPPPRVDAESEAASKPDVSLLIPARDEATAIEGCLRAALASRGVDLEVIVLDDGSTDGTAAVVQQIATEDDRVKLIRNHELPAGWCGKQHACYRLAEAATHSRLAWIDADVTLAPDALARMAAFADHAQAELVSAFPRQQTRALAETMIVPLINFLLVGYLPMMMMRMSRGAGFGVGCGQFVMADREAYFAVGGHGHESVRLSLHDGMTLPRAFREAGKMTDIADGKSIASCRMYDSFGTVWRGFAKNATEGMATPVGIWVWSVLLGAGHVLPWLFAAAALTGLIDLGAMSAAAVTASCFLAASYSVAIAVWFRQGWLAAMVRPAGVAMLLAIQWYAFIRKSLGKSPAWRGRTVEAPTP